MRSLSVAVALFAVVAAACSGASVPQEEHDQALAEIESLREWVGELQDTIEGGSEQLRAAEDVIEAYEAAMDPLEVTQLGRVYSSDVVVFDVPARIRSASRESAMQGLIEAVTKEGVSGSV